MKRWGMYLLLLIAGGMLGGGMVSRPSLVAQERWALDAWMCPLSFREKEKWRDEIGFLILWSDGTVTQQTREATPSEPGRGAEPVGLVKGQGFRPFIPRDRRGGYGGTDRWGLVPAEVGVHGILWSDGTIEDLKVAEQSGQ